MEATADIRTRNGVNGPGAANPAVGRRKSGLLKPILQYASRRHGCKDRNVYKKEGVKFGKRVGKCGPRTVLAQYGKI